MKASVLRCLYVSSTDPRAVILVDPAYGEPIGTGPRKTLDPFLLKEGDPDKKKLEGIITDNVRVLILVPHDTS